MRVGSLFSGVGGLDLGLERAGHQIIWQAENDTAASKILARHWPGLENFGDVTEVDWSTVERPDAICAGNPCPDFSQAGQRKGMAGEQGQLWFEVVRALRTLRPRTVILENVSGIYTSPGLALDSGESALGVVLSDLASLGYVGSYASIRASDFGACHRRERWFAIAHATSEGGREESGGASKYEATQNGGSQEANYVFGSASQGRLQTATATDTRSKRRHGSGRSDQSQATKGGENGWITTEGHSIPPTNPIRDELEGQGRPEQKELGQVVYGASEWGLYWPAISRWTRIFGRPAPEPADAGRLMPEFVEWMLGFEHGWTTGVAKTHRLRCLGNAVQVQVAEYLGQVLWNYR